MDFPPRCAPAVPDHGVAPHRHRACYASSASVALEPARRTSPTAKPMPDRSIKGDWGRGDEWGQGFRHRPESSVGYGRTEGRRSSRGTLQTPTPRRSESRVAVALPRDFAQRATSDSCGLVPESASQDARRLSHTLTTRPSSSDDCAFRVAFCNAEGDRGGQRPIHDMPHSEEAKTRGDYAYSKYGTSPTPTVWTEMIAGDFYTG